MHFLAAAKKLHFVPKRAFDRNLQRVYGKGTLRKILFSRLHSFFRSF